MHTESIKHWLHDHTFGQDRKKPGERRTLIVIVITAVTMFVEIGAGIGFGSMALLADGLHMGSHASALAVSAFAYYYTRRRAQDPRFNFGTGKVNSLAAFGSSVMLALFALVMAWESIHRLIKPVNIEFNWAIMVAIAGLIVNGICLVVLGGRGHSHGGRRQSDTETGNNHGQSHDGSDEHDQGHNHHDHGIHAHVRSDHNLWAAYLHVLADALTSLLAIFALMGAKYLGLVWLDPVMGIVGAVLVVRWSWGLLRASSHVLLDMQAPEELRETIKAVIEAEGDNRVSDLHVWAIGPDIYATEVALVTSDPKQVDHYARLIPSELAVVHTTFEVNKCVPREELDEASRG